ncbi:MarR family winged helix-turn-helix transcriptional regulator [Caballeronia sordidicola]|jgi:MarR family transcriptional regulator, organic hydroperoxide resistance regulator|uniref:MarR family winged helix-turn-helix transcriptional regulator n=1 Tax=Caballeronia sordidicola TaxID=196367 RepID=UPI0004CFF947|nr:MarR family transcriptional regulator [Caballeronia sordidicola]
MAKPYFTEIDTTLNVMEPSCGSSRKEAPEIFDDRGRTVPWMARTLNRLYDVQAQRILDQEKVSIAHWYYLRVLAQRGELNQLELSKRVGIASTTAVPALDSMEKRGLLKRTRDPKDRRKYDVSLTDDGKRLVDKMMPEIIRMISGSFDGVDPHEMVVFWKVLHQIAQNLSEKSSEDSVVD